MILPNFGDEQAVTQATDMSQLNVPVPVQARDETNATKLMLGKRRDSFCGKQPSVSISTGMSITTMNLLCDESECEQCATFQDAKVSNGTENPIRGCLGE